MRLRMFLMVMVVGMFFGGVAMGAGYVDGAHHFSYDPPAGWEKIPDTVIGTGSPSPGTERIGGFRDPDNFEDYCFVIKFPAYSRPTDVAMFRADLHSAHGEVIDARYDSRLDALVGEVRLKFPDRTSRYEAYAFTGADSTIVIYCYAPDATFEGVRGTYASMAGTFHFDGTAGKRSSGGALMVVLGVMICGGLTFVGAVVVGAVIFVVLRKRRSAV